MRPTVADSAVIGVGVMPSADQVSTRADLLQVAIDHTNQVILLLDADRRVVFANQALTTLFGYTFDELRGRQPLTVLSSPRSDPRQLMRIRRRVSRHLAFEDDTLARHKDGTDFWAHVWVDPVVDPVSGRLRHVVVVLTDVTLDRHIRDLQRDVLAALTSGMSFVQLGNYICGRIESVTPGVVASLTSVENDTLHPWAAPQLPESYARALDGIAIGESVASCGAAAFRGEPVIARDIATDPRWVGYRDVVLPLGLRACSSYPIKNRAGDVIGTFAFYFRTSSGADPQLARIARASVDLCALALERQADQRELARLIEFDSLTGLPNRAQLTRQADRILARADPEVAFFCVDVDRFKDVNNTLGHAVGDQVLVQVAKNLRQVLAADDVIGRIDGDQFGIVSPDHRHDRALRYPELLRETVATPMVVSGHHLRLTASIGASRSAQDGVDADQLLTAAEHAVHLAKDAGGNDYRFASSEMNQRARDRLLVGGALRRALADGDGLELWFQPQVRNCDQRLHGVEALLRWRHPTFGDLLPQRLIRLAEEIGAIDEIGRWTLCEACRQLGAWAAAGLEIPCVSVNLAPASLRDPELPAYVAGLLDRFGLAGRRLTIEVTESMMLDLDDRCNSSLLELRSLGVGLSIDDFGTGYSSLSTLTTVPVTEIKIDRGFIVAAPEDNRARSLIHAMLDIGSNLGLTVVAEGIETDAQREVLDGAADVVIQGFLFSRPLPPCDLVDWVRRR